MSRNFNEICPSCECQCMTADQCHRQQVQNNAISEQPDELSKEEQKAQIDAWFAFAAEQEKQGITFMTHAHKSAFEYAWKAALHTDIYEDVYEQCQELINPHIMEMQHGSACGDKSLCASVVGSLGFLIEFWLKNRETKRESGWLPIETAPKDGRFVLLCGGSTNEEIDGIGIQPPEANRPVVAKWITGDDDWRCDEGWTYALWDGMWYSMYENPTHWMPITSTTEIEGEQPCPTPATAAAVHPRNGSSNLAPDAASTAPTPGAGGQGFATG